MKKKKRGKKKFVQNLDGLRPIELKDGLGTGRACGARSTQARRRRHGRGARGRRAHGLGASGHTGAGRARQANAGQARGRRAHAADGRHGCVAGRHAGSGRRAGHGRLGGLGVQLGQVGCFGAPD